MTSESTVTAAIVPALATIIEKTAVLLPQKPVPLMAVYTYALRVTSSTNFCRQPRQNCTQQHRNRSQPES